MEKKPIKRNENIVPLSRDHHGALLLGWKIKQGLKNEIAIERIKDYVLWYWEHHLLPHHEAEESTIFKGQEYEGVQKALREHRDMSELMHKLAEKVDEATLMKIATDVEAHVRFEERELFPHLEKILSQEKLAEIGKVLETHDTGKEDYPDEFWQRKTK